MREIKFRAWDKLTQKYWNIENWHFEDEYLDLIESGVSVADPNSERVWRKFNEVELMQYTGLKDVNGVEIYEGDVVKFDTNVQILESEVAYYHGMFTIKKYGEKIPLFTALKVIGNKFENPKLLEVTDNEQ
ncbi:DNA-packaging protein [Latilactobacillus curvatus]|uniref:YopX family protein n=1 Tax=Latilactobacillus curvatus TaxID=28038 RepID=UPI0011BBE5B2|nr:YopX family protein [Latilactobacillus curvatus]QEA49929.1 DNA-packaging protein [Latilactobacillus curvatus]